MTNKKIWKDEDVQFLKDNYQDMTCSEIAKHLGRTTKSVQHKFNQLNLQRRMVQVGDVIKGWEVIGLFTKDNKHQSLTMARIKSQHSGKERVIKRTLLNRGMVGRADEKRPSTSKSNETHGLSGHRLYSIWGGMKSRCSNPKQISYKNYGARGISVCQEWEKSFESFYVWAMDNGYADDLTLDRVDINKGYYPENCRWATIKEQADSRRITKMVTAFGETKTLSDWSLDLRCKCTYATLCYRINADWDPEKAITSPSTSKNDNFRRYKQFYEYVKSNHPDIVDQFIETS